MQYLLLRFCCVHNTVCWLRCMPPRQIMQLASHHDRNTMQTFKDVMGTTQHLADVERIQIRTPAA